MDEFEVEAASLPPEQMQIHLVIVCDDHAGEFVEHWVEAHAREIRLGLAEMEFDAEITLTSSDGTFEQY